MKELIILLSAITLFGCNKPAPITSSTMHDIEVSYLNGDKDTVRVITYNGAKVEILTWKKTRGCLLIFLTEPQDYGSEFHDVRSYRCIRKDVVKIQ